MFHLFVFGGEYYCVYVSECVNVSLICVWW